MQKSLTCKNLKNAQKNIFLYSIILVLTNLIFLSLGVLLYAYVQKMGIELAVDELGNFVDTDQLFPELALHHFNTTAGIIFMLGIAAAAFSSADSALTALTTSFYNDFLNLDNKTDTEKKRVRNQINIGFSIVLITIIMIFHLLNNESIINMVFTIASYTYGPLLGLFGFGLSTTYQVKDKWVPLVALLAPVLAYFLNVFSIYYFAFDFGYTLLFFNGVITFIGLWLIRIKNVSC